MKINPFELKTKIQAMLAEFPELNDDEQFKLDTLEAETDLFEVLSMTLSHIRQATTMQDAIDLRLKDLKARKERYEQREEAWRRFAKQLMETAHLRNIVLTEATMSIRNGQPSVRIIEEMLLPKKFWRVKREPNVAAIKDALKSGTEVPGAALNNAPDTLTITTK